MLNAYRNELALMPHVAEMERRGVHLNIDCLSQDTDYYFGKLDWLDKQIQDTLKCKVDIDSNADLADAIERAGLSRGFAQTPKGKRSTSKDSLIAAVADPTLLGHLLVRGSVATCLRTFLAPWLVQAKDHGKLYIKWNQFRNYTDTGARTGRLSSSPNLQNIPVEWEALRLQLSNIQYALPFELPSVRKYIVPPPGYVFIGRDYAAQEMRLLAHFTEGALLEALIADPEKDIHMLAASIADVSRRVAKTLGFAILYGAGVGKIAESLGVSVGEATIIKARYLKAMPEIKKFTKAQSELGRTGRFITTLSGRQYYVQSPAVIKGILKTFEYKLSNYKIQGSAADQSKQAMYDYCTKTRNGQLVLSVHDQLIVQVPQDCVKEESQTLEQAMNGSYQDTLKYKVISDESIGASYAEL